MTTPIFICGSGRCGTYSLYRVLNSDPQVEAHHEYTSCADYAGEVQRLGVLFYSGHLSKSQVRLRLSDIYGAAIDHCSDRWWADSSNKLTWILEPLIELLPQAKWLHLVRDGRKVVSSYYHKLAGEVYDDEANKSMTEFLYSLDRIPPPEKRYWWPVDVRRPKVEWLALDRFDRICWHWTNSVRLCGEILPKIVPADNYLEVKLEDLTSQPAEQLVKVYSFLGMTINSDIHAVRFLDQPTNVHDPTNIHLLGSLADRFWAFPGVKDTMARYGYEGEEYDVEY